MLLLRKQRAQERIEGRPQLVEWNDDDFAVVDGETRVGRIRREQLPGGVRWLWFMQTAPVAPPPNSGSADTLDEAKAAIRARYESIQAQCRRS